MAQLVYNILTQLIRELLMSYSKVIHEGYNMAFYYLCIIGIYMQNIFILIYICPSSQIVKKKKKGFCTSIADKIPILGRWLSPPQLCVNSSLKFPTAFQLNHRVDFSKSYHPLVPMLCPHLPDFMLLLEDSHRVCPSVLPWEL